MAKSVYQQVHEAIDQYEQDCADGTLTFTGEFADEAPDEAGGWIGQNVTSHVALMDVSAGAR